MKELRKRVFEAALDRLGTDVKISSGEVIRVLRDLDYEKSTPGEFILDVAERRYRCFSDVLTFNTKESSIEINGLTYSIARVTPADDDGLISYLYLK